MNGYEPRRVLVSPELMGEWRTFRNVEGYLITMDWGEPDKDGFYNPTFTRHYDDHIHPPHDHALPDRPVLELHTGAR